MRDSHAADIELIIPFLHTTLASCNAGSISYWATGIHIIEPDVTRLNDDERIAPRLGSQCAPSCRWVSIVYMSLAQLGAARPRKDTADGWAWAGPEDPLLASRLSDFVTAALRAEAEIGVTPAVSNSPVRSFSNSEK